VGLRGYGGRDPLVEFKREAFSLYDELRGFIQHQVASTIYRVSVQRREAAPPDEPRTLPTPTAEQLAALKRSSNGGGARDVDTSAAPPSTGAGTVTPPVSSGGSATATSGATVTTTAQLIPGLAPQTPTNVQLQKGDEQVETGQARATGHTPDGEKIGRNDPCYCGSGKKYKRCHGAS
jgi:preprotein translocase subunit SecA